VTIDEEKAINFSCELNHEFDLKSENKEIFYGRVPEKKFTDISELNKQFYSSVNSFETVKEN